MTDFHGNKLYSDGNTPDVIRYSPRLDVMPGWFVACVDACSYGRAGLHFTLKHHSFMAGRKRVVVVSTLDAALQAMWPYASNSQIVCCLVVRLPPLAREALIALLQLSEMMQYTLVRYHHVVLLSSFDVPGLQRLVTIMGMANVRIVDARLPLPELCGAVLFTPEKWMSEDRLLSQVLTPHERSALCRTLQFWSVLQQARARQVSVKTIYSQRLSALTKLEVKDMRSFLTLLDPC